MNNDEWNYLLSFQVWKLVDRQIQIHVTDGLAVFVVLKFYFLMAEQTFVGINILKVFAGFLFQHCFGKIMTNCLF